MSETSGPGHERPDVQLRPIVLAGLGLLALLAVLAPAGTLLLRYYAHREATTGPPPSPIAAREVPPAPRLQVTPRKDLQTLRAEERALLEGYAWVDRGAGTVRIPIERAMALLAERRPRTGER